VVQWGISKRYVYDTSCICTWANLYTSLYCHVSAKVLVAKYTRLCSESANRCWGKKLNQKWSGISIQISGFGSLPDRFQDVVDLLPCRCLSFCPVWKSADYCMTNANKSRSAVPQWWGNWKSDLVSVSRTGSPPKVNQFFKGRPKFQWNHLITFAVILLTDRANDRQTELIT